jgi:hypothetical protein
VLRKLVGTRLPSDSRASTQGDDSSTRRPSGATILSITCRTASSPSNRPSVTSRAADNVPRRHRRPPYGHMSLRACHCVPPRTEMLSNVSSVGAGRMPRRSPSSFGPVGRAGRSPDVAKILRGGPIFTHRSPTPRSSIRFVRPAAHPSRSSASVTAAGTLSLPDGSNSLLIDL